jgi:UDP-2-acetamido-3-amino-2,3-dideoxy-glucuronate N-acetyltransferase
MSEATGYFVHESSYVDEPASIGEGTKIWHFSHVMKNAVIGRNCNIGQNVVISPGVRIGDGCKIQNNVSVYEGVVLEDFVFCGPSMVFTNVMNPRSEIVRRNEYQETRVGRGASIGANATIVCGNSIGAYAFIGAGAVVTKDVPSFALMVGNPARRRGWICRCGIKLTLDETTAYCASCGSGYRLDGEALVPI